MEKFYVKKKILANGERWSRLLSKDPRNFFGYPEIQQAWKDMEYQFTTETVLALLEEIDRVYCDGWLPEPEDEIVNQVTIKFTNKRNPIESQRVVYTFCGEFLEPEVIEYHEKEKNRPVAG